MSNPHYAVDSPEGRRSHQPKKVTASVVASVMLVAALAPLASAPAQAATAQTGPVSAMHGYPEWYDDGTVKLALCYEAGKGCLSEPPNPDLPASYPDNFPDESFWFQAAATVGDVGSYEAALEAAHANEAVIQGDQIGFGRLRFRFDGLTPNGSYTVTHPYGVHTFTASATGVINETIDDGCLDTPCDWNAVGQAFLGEYSVGTATFLRQTTAPAGTIGDINTARTVTGAPSGVNSVSIVGPGVDVTTNLFTVQGLIAQVDDGAPGTPNLVDASDSGSSATDNITNVATPTFSGAAPAGATSVEVLVDGQSVGTATVTGGNYSFTSAALPSGQHTVQARVASATGVGGFASSGTLTITVDTVAPTTTIVAPFPSSPSLNNQPTFHFSGNEATATFQCALSPANPDFTACTSAKTWDAQLNGTHTFSVRATDRAGNLGAAVSRTIVIGTASSPVATEQKDMNGDSNPDLVARDSGGVLWLYKGNGTGGFQPRTQIGTGWNIMNSVLQPGDFNGDGRSDLMARDTSGRLFLYPGNGTGGVNTRTQIGSGWNIMTNISTPGDVTSDGRADLVARDSSGVLWLYRGTGTGTFQPRVQLGTGWNIMTSIFGAGDWSGDGRNDLVARDSSGVLWLYRGTGAGTFQPRVQIGAGWNVMNAIRGAGAWDTGATEDVIARDSSGALWLYRGNGTGGFSGTRTQIGSGWSGYMIVQ